MSLIDRPFLDRALRHRQAIASNSLRLQERPSLVKIVLRGEDGVLKPLARAAFGLQAPKACKSAYGKSGALHWLGPDRLIWIAEEPGSRGFLDILKAGEMANAGQIVDVSHHYALIEIAGERARDALQKLSTLDLYPDRFGKGDVAGTVFAHVSVVLAARAADRFDILVRRSEADYLWCLLADAGYEYGLPQETPRSGEILRGG